MATERLAVLGARVCAETKAWANTLGWVRFGWAITREVRKNLSAGPFKATMRAILGVLFLAACTTACAVETSSQHEVEQLEQDSGQVDTGPSSPDAGTVALPDARPDAGHPDALPARSEASAEGSAAVQPDAGAALPDGARSDGGVDARETGSGDANVDKANADIHRVFPQPCTPNAISCGTVDHVENGTTLLLTYPLFCWAGAWGLAWNGTNVTFTCSRACGYAQLCAP
jgi:hypothetical protein